MNSPSDSTGPWTLVSARTAKLKQGELELDLTLRHDSLEVTKTYVVYPGSSIIREWSEFKNTGSTPLKLTDPEFLKTSARLGDRSSVDFHWMTGGDNAHGSWVLKTEKLSVEKPRQFDSYDPFPDRGVCGDFVDDQPNLAILVNDKPIWPVAGQFIGRNANHSVPIQVSAEVSQGDRIVFRTAPNRAFDDLQFDPAIAYADGEVHIASKEFAAAQGRNGWSYQLVNNGKFTDLIFNASDLQWQEKKGDELGPYVAAREQRGGLTEDAVRTWAATRPGTVTVTANLCSGALSADAKPGFRAGSSSYAPWSALFNSSTHDGLFIGWDYFGRWASAYSEAADGTVTARMHVAGYHRDLMPGESVQTPKAFIGLFAGDLDDAGNTLLDWQYRYLWDYTRDGWFPGIRMLGDWWKGTSWGLPEGGWTGGGGDYESTYRKVFRLADMMREVGADVYHRDWGWWDRAGDWNGPDFRGMGDYLRKSDMGRSSSTHSSIPSILNPRWRRNILTGS